MKRLKNAYYALGAMVTTAALSSTAAIADDGAVGDGGDVGGGNNFSTITSNIIDSISSLPALVSALSYLMGLILAVLGIIKIKDHVERPEQEKLSHGAIRLLAGGAFLALPMILEAMTNTVGLGEGPDIVQLNSVGDADDLLDGGN